MVIIVTIATMAKRAATGVAAAFAARREECLFGLMLSLITGVASDGPQAGRPADGQPYSVTAPDAGLFLLRHRIVQSTLVQSMAQRGRDRCGDPVQVVRRPRRHLRDDDLRNVIRMKFHDPRL